MDKTTLNQSPVQDGRVEKRYHWFLAVLGSLILAVGIIMVRFEFKSTADGRVYREREVRMFAPVEGFVDEIFVRDGDLVEYGDLLLRFDTLALDMRILETERQLTSARSELAESLQALELLDVDPAHAAMVTAPQRAELIRQILDIREDIMRRLTKLEEIQAVSGLLMDRERMSLLESQREILEAEHLSQLKSRGYFEKLRASLELRTGHLHEMIATIEREIELLQRKRERLFVRAPMAGEITYTEVRYPGIKMNEGALILKMSPADAPFRVRAYIGQRNLDLVRPGMSVRMESMVFDSPLEGYVEGEVEVVSREPSRDVEGPGGEPLYEVRIAVVSTPYPLVLGSTLRTEIILGRRSLASVFMRNVPGRGEYFELQPKPVSPVEDPL